MMQGLLQDLSSLNHTSAQISNHISLLSAFDFKVSSSQDCSFRDQCANNIVLSMQT